MKKLLFLVTLGLLFICLFISCEKEDESERLFNQLKVVSTYPLNGESVDTYLFNNVEIVFNKEITNRETLDMVCRSIRVYNKTTNKDITDKIYVTHSLKLDGHKINIKQLIMFLPDCEYKVEIYLPKGKYSFQFFTKSSTL